MDSSHDRVWGWADPGVTVDVHVHGIVRQNVIADGSRKMEFIYWTRKRKL